MALARLDLIGPYPGGCSAGRWASGLEELYGTETGKGRDHQRHRGRKRTNTPTKWDNSFPSRSCTTTSGS